MIQMRNWMSLVTVTLMVATVGIPHAGAFMAAETNYRLCGNDLDPDRKIAACTWLLENSDGFKEYVIPDALKNRGWAWMKKHEYSLAIEDYSAALRYDPNSVSTLNNRGVAQAIMGKYNNAIEDYTAALRIDRTNLYSISGLAWILATAEDATVRDGSRAIRLAERGVSLDADRALFHDTLAAAYAESGRFKDAVKAQMRAIQIARDYGRNAERIAAYEKRLHLYRNRQPYREKYQ